MHAKEARLTKLLEDSNQFIIPIYQRTYSWTEKQCEQLWRDIENASKNKDNPHFIGSIVYIDKDKEQKSKSGVKEYFVIDGQQRLTTLTLLLSAFSKALKKQRYTEVTKEQISKFLLNSKGDGEKKYKLILTQSDRDTLIRLLDGQEPSEKESFNIRNNYEFFENKIEKSKINLDKLLQGIRGLMIVCIALDNNHDDPQLIFESLNSTGLELSQADLIRNYLLMDLNKEEQDYIYNNYWSRIEENFHAQGTEHFDRFMRDYLTIRTGQIPKIKDVYSSFKKFAKQKSEQEFTRELVSDIKRFAEFFCKLAFEKESDTDLNQKIADINALQVDVAYPFLLRVYSDYKKDDKEGKEEESEEKKITKNDILEIFSMVESYVFRRSICELPANSLNRIFANLARKTKGDYVESIKDAFVSMKPHQRFPDDEEFEGKLIHKDVYNTRIAKYLLVKLEKFSEEKETVSLEPLTVEHIMPQNPNLSEEWKKELGGEWEEIRSKHLHTIGNLTLTGYNPELSDKSFQDKQLIYSSSKIGLTLKLKDLLQWNKTAICKRADDMAKKSLEIWKYPELSNEKKREKDLASKEGEDRDTWDSSLERATPANSERVDELISMIDDKFDCVSEPYRKWLFFYTEKPAEERNLFAIVECKKYVIDVVFRINPNSFDADGEKVGEVAESFFPGRKGRKITMSPGSLQQIMRRLDQAYRATKASA